MLRVLVPSWPGNDAPGAFAMVIHQGERSKALPNAPNEPTGPSAPAAAQPRIDDDDVDVDDELYRRNDESRFLKQPRFAPVLTDDKTRIDDLVEDLPVPPLDPNAQTTTSTTTLTSYKQRRRLTSKRRRQLVRRSTDDMTHEHNHDDIVMTNSIIMTTTPSAN